MPDLSQRLNISVEDDDLIIIVPNPDLSDNLWRGVVLYWSPDFTTAFATRRVVVSVDLFVDKMSWLRDVWRSSGGTYDISKDVIDIARKQKDGSSAFRKLRTQRPGRHVGGHINIPGLVRSRTLTQEQIENVLCLIDMENGANFSVPGAGKTLTSLAVWKVLREKEEVGKLLVVCPRSAFESWQTEPKESFGDSGTVEVYSGEILSITAEICLVNYEQLENSSRLEYLKAWVGQNNSALVVDEAHRIKGGQRSIRWNAVRALAKVASRVDVLTGTPMPQGPRDLTSIFSVAWPKLSKRELDERTLPRLSRNTVFVRTTKGELELPEATLTPVSRHGDELQIEILNALRDRYVGPNFLSISDAKNLAKRGRAVMTMLAAASNPGLLSSRTFAEIELGFSWPPRAISADRSLSDLVDSYLSHEIPWKFKYSALRAKEIANQNEKVLIWSNFVGNLGALKAVLREFNPAVIYGGISQDDRVDELKRFRTDPSCSVLLANPQTLGEGVSLHQVCHFEIFVDRTYNAGLYLQAVDRIHRLGLAPDQKTSVELLVTKDTIDERVTIRLDKKIKALSAFLQDEHLVRASIPQGDELLPEDVLGLTDEDFADIASRWATGNE